MEEKKKVSLVPVILYCFCAVIWSLIAASDLFFGYKDVSAFVAHIFCAVAWDACAIMSIVRYRQYKKNSKTRE